MPLSYIRSFIRAADNDLTTEDARIGDKPGTGNPGDIHLLSECDAYPNTALKMLVSAGDSLRTKFRNGRESLANLSR